MSELSTDFTAIQETGKVRLSNSELHRRACSAVWEANHVVFESMPSLIAQIIEHEVWRDYQHDSFATYALDATSNGLGVNTNQRLWILRCSLDVHGKHIAEWADVLSAVEKMVKLIPVSERGSIALANGNSLESLAKNCPTLDNAKITYLPSRNKADDGHLMRLRKNHPELFQRIASREVTLIQARRELGVNSGNEPSLGRIKSAIGKLSPEELAELIEWLKDR